MGQRCEWCFSESTHKERDEVKSYQSERERQKKTERSSEGVPRVRKCERESTGVFENSARF